MTTWGMPDQLFLHDGRTSNVLHAIEAHARSLGSQPGGSHVQLVSPSQMQDILNFLRSL